jgi:CubicO group peptidase (beta-lactamase class C family)
MKKFLILFPCLLMTIFMSVRALGQNYDQSFDDILRTQLTAESPGGTVLVAKQGKVIYKKSFGKANLELDVAMKPEHVFRIGSVTKQFTASAILKLAEEGKLSLADSITKFIKNYPTNGHTITIEHLLTHTSGIKNYSSLNKFNVDAKRRDSTPQELVDFFKNEPMDFPPGTDYRYSNSGYILLGYIIEIISGKTYADYINENFFKPLAMKSSFYDHSSAIIPNRVPGYTKRNGHFENSDYLSMTLPYSAGSLLSNVEDLFIWYEALLNNRILSRQVLETAHTPHRLGNGRSIDYGYGWRLGNIQESYTIRHGGLVNGFATFSVYLPIEKVFVAIFSNCDCSQNLEYPASKMAAIVLGKPYDLKAIDLSAKEMGYYQAVYKPKYYNDQRIIAYEDGKLFYYKKGGSKSQLFPVERDKFSLENSLSTLEFERDLSGNITGFNIKSTESPVAWIRTDEAMER